MEKDFYETRKEIYERKGWELPSDPQNQVLNESRVDLLKLYLELDTSKEK
jgi:hypothetical protein